jgi:hypothetical protein
MEPIRSIGGRSSVQPGNWVAKVQRFVRRRQIDDTSKERCELCGAQIPPLHRHLVQPTEHRILCACQACGMLFGSHDDGKYRLIPEAVRVLDDFRLSDAEWDALGIPIGLAFFFYSTPEQRILALYPGPAGPTESRLALDAWTELVANNPVLAGLEPDVEALLVNRVNGASEYYAMPIDRCYALVGLIRKHWRGIAGGGEAWAAIGNFFLTLRVSSDEAGASRHG